MKKAYLSLIILLLLAASMATAAAAAPAIDSAALSYYSASDFAGSSLLENDFAISSLFGQTHTAKMSATYLGNNRTKKFHYPECKWAKLYIAQKPHEVVYFNTRLEAVNAGYEPCKRCKP